MESTNQNTPFLDGVSRIEEIVTPDELHVEDWKGITNDLLRRCTELESKLVKANQDAQIWRTRYETQVAEGGSPFSNLLRSISQGVVIGNTENAAKLRLLTSFELDDFSGEAA